MRPNVAQVHFRLTKHLFMVAERVFIDNDNTYSVVCDFVSRYPFASMADPAAAAALLVALTARIAELTATQTQMTAVRTRIVNENKQLHDTVLELKSKASAAAAAPVSDPLATAR